MHFSVSGVSIGRALCLEDTKVVKNKEGMFKAVIETRTKDNKRLHQRL